MRKALYWSELQVEKSAVIDGTACPKILESVSYIGGKFYKIYIPDNSC